MEVIYENHVLGGFIDRPFFCCGRSQRAPPLRRFVSATPDDGASAGGILAGRAITERPDLFGAAWISMGTLDTLLYETTANGAPTILEFGSTRTKEGFESLPMRNLLDILFKVESWTNFTRHFNPVLGSDPKLDRAVGQR